MKVISVRDEWEVDWKTGVKLFNLYSKIPGSRAYGLWSDKHDGIRFYFKNGIHVDLLGLLAPFRVKYDE